MHCVLIEISNMTPEWIWGSFVCIFLYIHARVHLWTCFYKHLLVHNENWRAVPGGLCWHESFCSNKERLLDMKGWPGWALFSILLIHHDTKDFHQLDLAAAASTQVQPASRGLTGEIICCRDRLKNKTCRYLTHLFHGCAQQTPEAVLFTVLFMIVLKALTLKTSLTLNHRCHYSRYETNWEFTFRPEEFLSHKKAKCLRSCVVLLSEYRNKHFSCTVHEIFIQRRVTSLLLSVRKFPGGSKANSTGAKYTGLNERYMQSSFNDSSYSFQRASSFRLFFSKGRDGLPFQFPQTTNSVRRHIHLEKVNSYSFILSSCLFEASAHNSQNLLTTTDGPMVNSSFSFWSRLQLYDCQPRLLFKSSALFIIRMFPKNCTGLKGKENCSLVLKKEHHF